ncbi:LAFA_0C10836g1_1 [Lachancea sp. 'fantastica']|nr:LAFA_0C10836g1_1 [Lachancea sp. 'fantastica']
MDTPDRIRRKLDAFKQFVVYSTLYNSPDKNVQYFTEDLPSEWAWIKSVYRQLAAEHESKLPFRISHQPPDGVIVSGKSFSRGYIRSHYSTCEERFGEIVKDITEFYQIPTVKEAAFEVLDDPREHFGEDLSEPKLAFQQLVSRSAKSRINPKELKPAGSFAPDLIKSLDECTVLLLWMIFFACGAGVKVCGQ